MCLTAFNPGDDFTVQLDMLYHSPKTVLEFMELLSHRADLPAEVSDAAATCVHEIEQAKYATLAGYREWSEMADPEEFNKDHQEPLPL